MRKTAYGVEVAILGAIAVAIITSAAMILTNFVKIRDTFPKDDPLETRISQSETPEVEEENLRHPSPAGREPSVVQIHKKNHQPSVYRAPIRISTTLCMPPQVLNRRLCVL